MGDWIEVIPAYGRDYKNQAEVKKAWAEGKDFQEVTSRSYVGIRDAKRLGLSVIVRYASLQKVVDVTNVKLPN